MLCAAYTDLKPGCETQITQGRGEVVIKVSRQAESEEMQKAEMHRARSRTRKEEAWANTTRNRENREKKAKEQVTQRIESIKSEDAAADADKAINPEIKQQNTGEVTGLTTTIEKREGLMESADEHAIGVENEDAKVEIQAVEATAEQPDQAEDTKAEMQERDKCSCQSCNNNINEQQIKQRSVDNHNQEDFTLHGMARDSGANEIIIRAKKGRHIQLRGKECKGMYSESTVGEVSNQIDVQIRHQC